MSKTGEENEYERQRAKRIEENRARMAALGLATSLMGSSGKGLFQRGKKKKRKDVEDDEGYMPIVEESDVSSSSEEDEEERSASRTPKGKKKSSTPKKKIQVQKLESNSDFVDEDEAFMQALALSSESKVCKENEGCSGLSGNSERQLNSGKSTERKGVARIKKETGTGKQKKQLSSRVQMAEDELVVNFFQFDGSSSTPQVTKNVKTKKEENVTNSEEGFENDNDDDDFEFDKWTREKLKRKARKAKKLGNDSNTKNSIDVH